MQGARRRSLVPPNEEEGEAGQPKAEVATYVAADLRNRRWGAAGVLLVVGLGHADDFVGRCNSLQRFARAVHRQGVHAVGNSCTANIAGCGFGEG